MQARKEFRDSQCDVIYVVGNDLASLPIKKEGMLSARYHPQDRNKFKLFFLGNGKRILARNEFDTLPRCNNLIIQAHGTVIKNTSGAEHVLSMFGSPNGDNSLEILIHLQQKTHAKNILVLTCYGTAILTHMQGNHFLPDTTILTAAFDNEISLVEKNFFMAQIFIEKVYQQQNYLLFNACVDYIKKIPQTFAIARLSDSDEMKMLILKRVDRRLFVDAEKYIHYQLMKLNLFARKEAQLNFEINCSINKENMNFYNEISFADYVILQEKKIVSFLLANADIPQPLIKKKFNELIRTQWENRSLKMAIKLATHDKASIAEFQEIAAKCSRYDIYKLLEAIQKINTPDNNGNTSLHRAVSHAVSCDSWDRKNQIFDFAIKKIEILLKEGANPEICNHQFIMPLDIALSYNCLQAVTAFVDKINVKKLNYPEVFFIRLEKLLITNQINQPKDVLVIEKKMLNVIERMMRDGMNLYHKQKIRPQINFLFHHVMTSMISFGNEKERASYRKLLKELIARISLINYAPLYNDILIILFDRWAYQIETLQALRPFYPAFNEFKSFLYKLDVFQIDNRRQLFINMLTVVSRLSVNNANEVIFPVLFAHLNDLASISSLSRNKLVDFKQNIKAYLGYELQDVNRQAAEVELELLGRKIAIFDARRSNVIAVQQFPFWKQEKIRKDTGYMQNSMVCSMR